MAEPQVKELGTLAADDVLTDRVYAELKREIHLGTIEAGERLVERSIAESKNVSRTPVREALRRLRAEGLTEYAPRRGFIVAALSTKDIDEIYVLRETLEGLAAREAAVRMDAVSYRELERLLPPMERAAAAGHVEEMRRLNQRYHQRIIELTGMKHLLQLVTELGDRIEYYRRKSLSLEGRPNHTVEEHRLILHSLGQSDPDLAEAAMRLHIRRAREAARVMLGFGRDAPGEDAATGQRLSTIHRSAPPAPPTDSTVGGRAAGAGPKDEAGQRKGGD